MVFAINESLTSSLTNNNNNNSQQIPISETNKTQLSKEVQQLDESTCLTSPISFEKNQGIKELPIKNNSDPGSPIRVKVPTMASTGSLLLIEGTGFIPFEQVKIELSVEWISSLPEIRNTKYYECKIVDTNSYGNFSTTLKLPEMPLYTKGIGKYSIIGMESMQEQNSFGTFSTSKMGFSFRQ